jgi:hypothetical protein
MIMRGIATGGIQINQYNLPDDVVELAAVP